MAERPPHAPATDCHPLCMWVGAKWVHAHGCAHYNAPRCEHEDFIANVDVNRLTKAEGDPVTAFSADIRVRCANPDCAEEFRFLGIDTVGDVANQPAVSMDHKELRVPIVPASAPPGWGLDRVGFTMRFNPGANN